MTEYYNKYLTNISESETYISEVSIVNTNNIYISSFVAFVEYIEDNKWKKGIFNMTDELKEIYFQYKKNSKYINKRIKNIQISRHYYSYIKIIKDKKNPQLEGQIMIFKYGNKICNIINNYVIYNHLSSVNHTFMIQVAKKSGFPDFNISFTNNEQKFEDYSLNINNDINFKILKISNIERKEKLKKLSEI